MKVIKYKYCYSDKKESVYKFVIFFLFFQFMIFARFSAQLQTYKQFWNDFNFTRPIAGKWAGEANIGSTFTNSNFNKSMFANLSQVKFGYWMHYYLNSRWKISALSEYFYNYSVPDIGQVFTPEWRIAPQAIYYIHKRGYTVSTRSRLEIRLRNPERKGFNDYYRFRQQIRYLHPINSKIIRAGVWYSIVSEEIFVNLQETNSATISFDRNQLTIGAGYTLNDDLLLEITYVNEYAPRMDAGDIYHCLSLGIVLNNFRTKFSKRIHKIFPELITDE